MRKLLVLAFILTIGGPLPAFAHSQEDVAACKPDVFRLCTPAIPNEQRIVACLIQNKQNLSSACYKVFDRDPTDRPVPSGPVETTTQWGR